VASLLGRGETARVTVGEEIPDGWRVLDGNNDFSRIARVAMRFEVELPDA